jgi:VanZ family protein
LSDIVERSAARRLVPALAWAALILVLTSLPGRALPTVPIAHLDKVVHLSLYAVLAALAASAVPAGRRLRALVVVLAAASAYGAFDEWHQQFVPGRSDDRYDWIADTVGAGVGVLFIAAARARREFTS